MSRINGMRRTAALALAGIAMVAAAPASHAQGSQCECVLPQAAPGELLGSITSINANGSVKVSQSAGFVDAATGDGLVAGSRVMVGPGSWAAVSLGASCQIVIPENATLRIDATQSGYCAWRDQPQASAPVSNDLTKAILGAAAIGGVAAGAIVFGLGNDDPVSQ